MLALHCSVATRFQRQLIVVAYAWTLQLLLEQCRLLGLQGCDVEAPLHQLLVVRLPGLEAGVEASRVAWAS